MSKSNNYRFSLLMAVYKNDYPAHFEEAINSILCQTLLPNEIVLVQDGPVGKTLLKVIQNFVNNSFLDVKYIELTENVGLGAALAEGLMHVKYPYVARMDSDDISDLSRFEIQMQYLKENPDISVLGSFITEFDKNNSRRLRKVPTDHELAKKYIRFRSPMNHVSVIFKKNDVMKAGNYESVLRYEDFYLWSKMIFMGYRFANIPSSLVDVRAGRELIKRLNGYGAFKKDFYFFKKLYNEKYIKNYVFFINILVRLFTRLVPWRLTSLIYFILRKL